MPSIISHAAVAAASGLAFAPQDVPASFWPLAIACSVIPDNEKYFFPWTTIAVSPISIGAFLSQRGWFVLKSEFLWVWLPASVIAAVSIIIRKVLARFW